MKLKLKEKTTKILVTVLLSLLNIYVGYLAFTGQNTIFWLAFILVWFNLLFGWLVQKRQLVLASLFWMSAVIIAILSLLYKFVILGRSF